MLNSKIISLSRFSILFLVFLFCSAHCKKQQSEKEKITSNVPIKSIPSKWRGKFFGKVAPNGTRAEVTIKKDSLEVYTEPPQMCKVKVVVKSDKILKIQCSGKKNCDAIACLKEVSIEPAKDYKGYHWVNSLEPDGTTHSELIILTQR